MKTQNKIKLNNDKSNFFKFLLKFLFPIYPVKITTSIYLLVFMGALVALRIVLGLFGVPVIPFGFKISFAWLPIYICGFFFGPVTGFIFGAAMDTMHFLIYGGIWFWMYAIQEPILGLLAGIVGSVYFLDVIKSLKLKIIIQKILVYFFICFTIVVVILQFFVINQKYQSGIKNTSTFVIIIFVMMFIFLIVNEIQNWIYYKRSKKYENNEYSLYLYISFLVILITVLFSFLLGPISYVKYLEYLNGSTPSKYLEYGTMYYLVPRVMKESIKTPIYIILLIGVIYAIKSPIGQFVNLSSQKW